MSAAVVVMIAASIAAPDVARAYRTAADLAEFEGTDRVALPSYEHVVLLRDEPLRGRPLDELETILNHALAAWRAPCSALEFRYQGRTASDALLDDGLTTVQVVRSGWVARGFTANAAATTDTRYEFGADGIWRLADADVYINDDTIDWSAADAPDLRAVIVHEMGHAIGLLHPCEIAESPRCSGAEPTSIMYPVYQTSAWALHDDDLDGLCALYPTDACADLTCPEATQCVSGTCLPTCHGAVCPTGFECGESGCVPACPGADDCAEACNADFDCATGRCIAGECVGAQLGDPCARGDECRSTLCSMAGYCTEPCGRTDCPGGYACEAEVCAAQGGAFGDPCGRGIDCASTLCLVNLRLARESAEAGESGSCTRTCRSDAECPVAHACATIDGYDVCRPAASVPAGCSVGAGGGGRDRGLAMTLLGVLAVLLGWRSARRPRVVASAVMLAVAAGCSSSSIDDGGGLGDRVSLDGGGFDDGGDLEQDGQVSAADAGLDAGAVGDGGPEPCSEPGATRTRTCGRCGLGSERCEDGHWAADDLCLDEGECAIGEVEEETSDLCGVRARICDATCAWRPWTVVTPDGECTAGATRTVTDGSCGPGGWLEECSAGCAWSSTCVDACGGVGRTSPADAREVCVPAGPFIRGHESTDGRYRDAQPEREITLGTFLIDRFPVTNRRYLACMDAGACAAPGRHEIYDPRARPERANHPVQGVSWDQAVAFCAWDGDRRLPTEAEWEKSARGPAPRRNLYPWDGAYDCARLYSSVCGWVDPTPDDLLIEDEVDDLPGTASFYGAEMMIGGGLDWVADWYDDDYYAVSPAVDPPGPGSGTSRVLRGERKHTLDASRLTVLPRSTEVPTPARSDIATIRCARDAP